MARFKHFCKIKLEMTHLAQMLAVENRCRRLWRVGGGLTKLNLKISINCPLSLKTTFVLQETWVD